MFDVAVIGGGICGCSLLYELSRYHIRSILLEKENDISVGTTKANSAIVHAGYDPEPGTKMARYNVEGNRLIEELCKKLDVPYRKIGSLVIAFDPSEMQEIQTLYERGIKNGVPDLRILSREEALQMEPNLTSKIEGALYAPSAGVVSPWELALALAETAVKNGAEVALRHEVTAIKSEGQYFEITAGNKTIQARFVINAAGIHADTIHNMVSNPTFSIQPNKGQYYLLDKSEGNLVRHVIFQCPTKVGKGVLVSPTVHGNLIVGPDAVDAKADDLATTAAGLEFVRETALKSVPSVNFRTSIRNFCGLRAVTDWDDFIIEEATDVKGFFDVAGIKSPGLTSAPAIAVDVVRMLQEKGLSREKKKDFIDTRKVVRFHTLSHKERAEVIRKNPAYGVIVCRCETVTEGEIVEALHRPIVPCSIDGIKRRCGSGMGRCQGGFCGPKVQEIVARELHLPLEQIPQDRDGMQIVFGRTKGEISQ